MPKKVDRRQRRREIAETYVRIVARDGIEAASTRALVQELGTSTGSLWYWFDSFDEVLSESFQLTFARTNERIADRVAGRSGLAALVAMLREIAPLDPVATSEALVVVSFWGRVVTNRAMARHQIAVVYEWGRQFRLRLEEARELGEIVPEAPVETLAETLLVLTDGLQIESALGAPLAERERQWRLLRGTLSSWVTPHGQELIP
ncbi:TetR/AcrR family transcriptional regulator [Nesterenkonia suensis]